MNNNVAVLRHSKGPNGAFGVLFRYDGIPIGVTLENEETLLPSFTRLICVQDYYHHGGYPTYEIQVPGRDRLLFHKLNWDFQSKGCIGVGEAYETLDNKPAIAQSEKGFKEFWETYKQYKTLNLVVLEYDVHDVVQSILNQ